MRLSSRRTALMHPAAAVAVVLMTWLVIVGVAFAVPRILAVDPILGLAVGLAVALPYPGIAAWLATRSEAEAAVTIAAAVVPAMTIAVLVANPNSLLTSLAFPLGVGVGVAVGMWIGAGFIRRGSMRSALTGVVGAGVIALVILTAVALPAALLASTPTN